jgi:hypothetical protein
MLKYLYFFSEVALIFCCNNTSDHLQREEMSIGISGKFSLEEVSSLLSVDPEGLDTGAFYYIAEVYNNCDTTLFFPSIKGKICYAKTERGFTKKNNNFKIIYYPITEFPGILYLSPINPHSNRKFVFYMNIPSETEILYLEFLYANSLLATYPEYKITKVYSATKDRDIIGRFTPPVNFWDVIIW